MDNFKRRSFLCAAGTFAGANLMATTCSRREKHAVPAVFNRNRSTYEKIVQCVQDTPFIDTHEHFWEESLRIRSARGEDPGVSIPAPDFGILFTHYADSDLHVSGMPRENYDKLLSRDVPAREKWALIAPWYERCRHTGYLQCLRESLRVLFDEDDLREDNAEHVSRLLKENITPGFYKRLLREVANIEYAHVNCLQSLVFRETEQPELLGVDLSINTLFRPPDLDSLKNLLGRPVTTLDEARQAIDTCFTRYAPRAIAIKSQCAYFRPLNFPETPDADAAPLFARFAAGETLTDDEQNLMQGHLFHYCLDKAAEYKLFVKLHTGYFAGSDGMTLKWVRDNAVDLCPIIKAHPDTNFVLFHIGYPYQEEPIALAKHYSNVYVDMCWSWILSPVASVRFLKEFLAAAPACKLFTFGGDYLPIEMSIGHASMARRGITQAVTEMVLEGWLEDEEVPTLVARIMNGNARECFNRERAARGV